jgi:hypothetical protein
MFTEESSQAIIAAFEMASENQPAGAPRIGELETNALSGMVEELAGADDEGTFFQSMLAELKEQVPGGFHRYANGWEFELWGYEDTHTEGIIAGHPMRFCVNVEVCADKDENYIYGATLEAAARNAFKFMKSSNRCSVCGKRVNESSLYCSRCLQHWNTKGCSVCGKRMGKLTDGVHEPCAKKQRTN